MSTSTLAHNQEVPEPVSPWAHLLLSSLLTEQGSAHLRSYNLQIDNVTYHEVAIPPTSKIWHLPLSDEFSASMASSYIGAGGFGAERQL